MTGCTIEETTTEQTTTEFTLNQLDPKVRQYVIDTWRERDSYHPWGDEWRDSLEAFAVMTPITIKSWEVSDWGPSHVNYTIHEYGYWNSARGATDEWADEMRGVRLWKWLRRNFGKCIRKGGCPLTGYYGDEALLEPIREAIAGHPASLKHTSLRDMIDRCLDGWICDYEDDIKDWHSEECIVDEIEANDHRFDADGRLL
jgi:hypothetical protein